MSKRKLCYSNCNAYANQYMILVAIFASIIAEEIENDEDLGILGSFLVALGEELALASEIRIACKERFEEESEAEFEIEDVFDRNYISNDNKKVRKKIIKKK